MATKEEAETTGGGREVGQVRTATERLLEGIGAEAAPGGEAAGGGDTLDVTSEDMDKAGAGGRYGEKQRGRERVSIQRENPASKSSGVVSREGEPEASGVAENLGGIPREWEGESSLQGASSPTE